jgi:hypothetical protein
MSRWLRWQFVTPRLLLCVVAALCVHFAAGRWVRSVAERTGKQLAGASVNVASARVSLSDGRVVLGAIRVANPCEAGQSWFTAEGCELEVAAAPLLTKQTIIPRARLSGVRLGPFSPGGKGSSEWFNDHAVEAAVDRLNRIDDRFGEVLVGQLESVRRTADFCEAWPKEVAALDARAAELVRRAEELEKELGAASVNQLRHSHLLDETPAKVAGLRAELQSLSDDFDRLPDRLEEQRRLIIASRRHDEEFVRNKLHVDAIDAELLNAYLLREDVSRQLDGLMAWLRRMRQVAPAEPAEHRAASRGQNVLFAGMRSSPNFLIRLLEMQGEATLASRPMEFRGFVTDVTTTPLLHAEPMRFRFCSKDSTPFEVRATIDRTGGRVWDELFVDCLEIPLDRQSLGRAEQLHLRLSPSRGSLTVSVSMDGDKLSGEIQLVRKQLQITPELSCNGKVMPIGGSLEQSPGQFDAMTTRVSLDGTIDQPRCTLWSNLGPVVAEALQNGLHNYAEARTGEILADARRQVDERLTELERQLAEHRERLATRIASMPQRIDAIDRTQARRGRLSVEQAGRRLPTTSILR